jgi:hypothetical protein
MVEATNNEKPKPLHEFSGTWVEDEDEFVEFAHHAQNETTAPAEHVENWEEDWEDEDPNDTFMKIKDKMNAMSQ